jgi:orotate phosphoribosyltransferase-like protein
MLRDERWHMIRNMVENGMKISEIAKELNVDRKTEKNMLYIP